MKAGKILSITLFSTLLAACSSSSGGGNGIRASGPPSLSTVPEQHRDAVSQAKTASLIVERYGGGTDTYILDGKQGEYNFSGLANGRSNLPISLSHKNEQSNTATRSGALLVYQQPYSVVTGVTWTEGSGTIAGEELNTFYVAYLTEKGGFSTPETAFTRLINQRAIFDYTGVAFDGQEEAALSYKMDFGKQVGSGSITGFTRTGLITLKSTSLNSYNFIRGEAVLEKDPPLANSQYTLSFFGPDAEELTGEVYNNESGGVLGDNEIIFAGKR